ncbi:hypothetical protein ACFU8Q_41210, partial [Streptomyces sp. NPDC057543]
MAGGKPCCPIAASASRRDRWRAGQASHEALTTVVRRFIDRGLLTELSANPDGSLLFTLEAVGRVLVTTLRD